MKPTDMPVTHRVPDWWKDVRPTFRPLPSTNRPRLSPAMNKRPMRSTASGPVAYNHEPALHYETKKGELAA